MKRHIQPTSVNDSKATEVASDRRIQQGVHTADRGLLARTRAVISILLDISKVLDRGSEFMARLGNLGGQDDVGRMLLA